MVIIYFIGSPNVASTQAICVGSQGDNIFLEGDFGAGTDNVLPFDPNYAPGFVYVFDPPFDDGFYTISNNSALWVGNFPTWLNIGDNSNDPNGYMMVVNANFQPGKFYEQTVEGLCENTTYNFTADVINFIFTPVPDHILPDVSFLLDGAIMFNSGPIPQDETWHTYGFSFTTSLGQTSVTLSIQNNAPGGNGNDLALDNIEFRPCGPNAIANTDLDGKVCESSLEDIFITAGIEDFGGAAFIQWQVSIDNGDSWSNLSGETNDSLQITNFSAGFYLYRYVFATSASSLLNEKCRTFSTPVSLEVVPLIFSINDTICEGNSYFFDNQALTISDTYVDSLISFLGCDSIVTLNLIVMPDINMELVGETRDPSCTGFTNGAIINFDINNFYAPIETFTINNDTVLYTDVQFFQNLAAGAYQMKAIDHFGCMAERTFTLDDPPIFEAIGQQDTIINLGNTFLANPLFSQPLERIVWEGGNIDRLSCTECLQPIIQPIQNSIYAGIGINASGCVDTFFVIVQVEIDGSVFVPNAITPNGDGINDFLNIFAIEGSVQSFETFQVFDRWGGLIFEGKDVIPNDTSSGWNGKVNGQFIEPGVYVYSFKVLLINGDIFEKVGSVTLLP